MAMVDAVILQAAGPVRMVTTRGQEQKNPEGGSTDKGGSDSAQQPGEKTQKPSKGGGGSTKHHGVLLVGTKTTPANLSSKE